MPNPVTDPDILAQLEAPQPITDPATLARLEKKPFGLGDTWPAKLAKSVWSGVTLPRDVYQGTASPEDTGRVLELATIGTPMAPRAVPSMGAVRGGPPTGQELLTVGGKQIEGARTSGVEIAPASVNRWADITMAELEKKGSNDILAPETFALLNRARSAPAASPAGSGLADPVATYDNLLTLRATLQGAAQKFTDTREQLAATRAIKSLDDYLANVPVADTLAGDAAATSQLYATGRGNYAAGSRSKDIGEARRDALLSAGAAHSGRNIGNTERQKFRSLVLNEKDIQGFSPAEIAQIEQNIVLGTRPMNTTRYWGNLLGGGGGMAQGVMGGIGAAVGAGSGGGPVAAALGAAAPITTGNMLRIMSNKLTDRQVRKLDEMVRSRSPMAEETATGGLTAAEKIKRDAVVRALMLEMEN